MLSLLIRSAAPTVSSLLRDTGPKSLEVALGRFLLLP